MGFYLSKPPLKESDSKVIDIDIEIDTFSNPNRSTIASIKMIGSVDGIVVAHGEGSVYNTTDGWRKDTMTEDSGRVFWIDRIDVHKDHRRRGYGSCILEAFEDVFKDMTLPDEGNNNIYLLAVPHDNHSFYFYNGYDVINDEDDEVRNGYEMYCKPIGSKLDQEFYLYDSKYPWFGGVVDWFLERKDKERFDETLANANDKVLKDFVDITLTTDLWNFMMQSNSIGL